jgi:hypothetical protein
MARSHRQGRSLSPTMESTVKSAADRAKAHLHRLLLGARWGVWMTTRHFVEMTKTSARNSPVSLRTYTDCKIVDITDDSLM